MKLATGWLCRDTRTYGEDWVSFYWIVLDSGNCWGTSVIHWTRQEFLAEYDLTENGKPCAPPAYGECFEVEIEL